MADNPANLTSSRLATKEWGEGPRLVLLHGFLGSSDDWVPVAEDLGSRFRCIAVDLPGHGQSKAVQLGSAPAFTEICQLLANTLSGHPLHLLGYSLGGRIALHLARYLSANHPGQLLSLTLESTHPGLQDPGEKQARLASDQAWYQRMANQPMVDFLDQWYRQPVFADLSETQRQTMIIARQDNQPAALAACYLGTSLGHQQDLRALDSLAIPVSLLTGERDAKFTGLGQDWAQGQSKLRHQVIQDAGHNIHRANPGAFLATLRQNLSH